MTDLFGEPTPPPVTVANIKRIKGRPKTNPLIRVYGPGPDGTKCGSCIQHYFRQFASNYPKCTLRGSTGSASTDHSSRYPTCGKYEPKPPQPA